jgi:hypothetical protein
MYEIAVAAKCEVQRGLLINGEYMGCDVRFSRLSTLQRNLSTTLYGVTFFQTESLCRSEALNIH